MPRQKRRYVPKVKGCYECSQRRIHCDRVQPHCGKCASRGILCSGLGIRYRFRDGGNQGKIAWQDGDSPQGGTWSGDLPQHQRSPSFHRGGSSEGQFDWTSNVTNDPAEPNALAGLGPDSPEASTGSSDAMAALPLSIDLVDPSNEFLLTYFSHHIAPQMVVMDDKYNGWRYLILPFALSDKMVMDAVLAVSAFHLSHKTRGTLSVRPDKLYAKAILGLQSRSSLNEYDMLTKQSIFVAIITLLVGVMVNGCSDFPILFNMLQSALDAVGGEGGLGNGDMTDFLLRQIRKFRVYAAPLLSEEAGVRSIVAHAKESFDCLHYNGNLHPDHALTFYLNAYLRQQAYDIYLERALTGPHGTLDPEKIERFKETLELFPEGSLGEHSLVWPTFIAASESLKDEHRLYFKQFLEKQFHRNGFLNLQQALILLEKIWARSSYTNWPALLPEPRVFIM
ncbi:hypothetical protein BDV37DRAFT_278787 [Aspergillus pseudonomiae]|uniref:Zn(2)-C6 fungal-type domain-containing protein n=1 Tax=Aspergillus pseudonomiae TaxID=1506151 RepID=A0A5N7DQQ8_9EURO|nr:uncharacterized protein BDV37DRAFT_278787 [Aspergillus pseudonomiae]KAE8408782.1 hypothetical protein BDV37DRAFT_278787 [Aspergillus pseudonomiae]